jgi:4-hydroxybenzoate polyprenyltransferase
MFSPVKSLLSWLSTLNSVDDPGETSAHRFLLSARLGLWPAIFLSAFAFRHLLGYSAGATAALGIDLSLVASIAFLFNDIHDTAIDEANNVHRWSVRSKRDAWLFITTASLSALVVLFSFFQLSRTAAVGVVLVMLISIAYSLICKRVFLLGNVVAAALSVSPGLIMFVDVQAQGHVESKAFIATSVFLAIAFLLLLSREIKFDQFDLPGDRVGGRMTVPMRISEASLNVVHGVIAIASLCLLIFIVSLNGRFSLPTNFVVAGITCAVSGILLFGAYRGVTKEIFYKRTRIVMLVVPLSMLLAF